MPRVVQYQFQSSKMASTTLSSVGARVQTPVTFHAHEQKAKEQAQQQVQDAPELEDVGRVPVSERSGDWTGPVSIRARLVNNAKSCEMPEDAG